MNCLLNHTRFILVFLFISWSLNAQMALPTFQGAQKPHLMFENLQTLAVSLDALTSITNSNLGSVQSSIEGEDNSFHVFAVIGKNDLTELLAGTGATVYAAGISLENDETITNSTDGTVLITALTTSLSGDLTVTGNDITFGNGETISNGTDGTIAINGNVDFNDNAITGYGADLQIESGTSKTLAASDNGTIIVCSSSSAVTITVPASLPSGFNCMIIQSGSGQVSLSASSTTLNNRNGSKTAGQYAILTLVHLGSNVFVVSGDTTS